LADQFVDPFMMVRLTNYNDFPLVNIASADISLPDKEISQEETGTSVPASEWVALIDRFKGHLGDKIASVRMTDRLSSSPARLVDPEGAPNQELQRVYRLLKEDFPAPQKILELNPKHPILIELNSIPSQGDLSRLVIDQIYEDALLVEGLHPNPVSMIERIQKIMEAALNKGS
jgi:molecular chaperone HtpG